MMNEPMRIQRKRTKGWKMPENTVSVTRPGKYGNQYRVVKFGAVWAVEKKDVRFRPILTREAAVRDALTLYHSDLMAMYHDARQNNSIEYAAMMNELRGKNLACYCKLCDKHKDGRPLSEDCPDCDPCHADILLKLANQ